MGDYVVRTRKGKPILVDKQILRWRRKRKKAEKLLEEQKAQEEIANASNKRFFE